MEKKKVYVDETGTLSLDRSQNSTKRVFFRPTKGRKVGKNFFAKTPKSFQQSIQKVSNLDQSIAKRSFDLMKKNLVSRPYLVRRFWSLTKKKKADFPVFGRAQKNAF